MPKKNVASSEKSKPDQPSTKQPLRILALQRPSPPPVVDKPVDDEVISPAGDKLVQEKVESLESATNKAVITKTAVTVEPNKHIDNLSTIDCGTKSIDTGTKSNNDPLIGTFIVVTAPWGQKLSVEVVDTYISSSGQKWACFNAVADIPDGWNWNGGVKKISSTIPESA